MRRSEIFCLNGWSSFQIRSSSTPFDALRVSINPPSYSRLKVRFGGLSLVGDALATAWRFSIQLSVPKGATKQWPSYSEMDFLSLYCFGQIWTIHEVFVFWVLCDSLLRAFWISVKIGYVNTITTHQTHSKERLPERRRIISRESGRKRRTLAGECFEVRPAGDGQAQQLCWIILTSFFSCFVVNEREIENLLLCIPGSLYFCLFPSNGAANG